MSGNYHNSAVEVLLLRLNVTKYLSKINLQSVYIQVKLCEEFQVITTFIAHLGVYRYTGLMFSTSMELLQKVTVSMFQNCEGTLIFLVDMVIHGVPTEENNQTGWKAWDAVLRGIREKIFSLNKAKCEFRMEITFVGHTITAQGFIPGVRNVRTVKEFREPRNAEEFWRFMCMWMFQRGLCSCLQPQANHCSVGTEGTATYLWMWTRRGICHFQGKS